MTEAYLLLIEVFNNDDVYVDHKKQEFVITVEGIKKYVSLRMVDRFISNKKNKDGK
tara:strand:+ start:21981 stop:22148 length:168 start_codon:yes stop_codon:yes gene_type:complete